MSDNIRLQPLPPTVRAALDEGRTFDDTALTDLRAHLARTAEELSETPTHSHFARVCRAALTLLDPVILAGHAGRSESIDAVVELLDFLEEGVAAHRSSSLEKDFGHLLRAVRAGRQGAADADASGLRRVDHRRLGEILMSLSLLHHRDLREALQTQRLHGKRIGAVLVEMGLIRSDDLDAALRVQRDERRAG